MRRVGATVRPVTGPAPTNANPPADPGGPRTVEVVQHLDGTRLTTPSDLVAYLGCSHRSWLDHSAALRGERRPAPSAELEVIAARGDEHEATVLTSLEEVHGPALRMEVPPRDPALLAAADAATESAMASGAPLIYQPTFFDPDTATTGRADFLVRVEEPSARWRWGYEVVDAKLARSATVAAAVQAYEYSRHITRLQGSPPARLHIAGTSGTATFAVAGVAGYAKRARARFFEFLGALADAGEEPPPSVRYPSPVPACDTCPWAARCAQRRRDDRHLSLTAGIRARDVAALEDAGVHTIDDLATCTDPAWAQLARQARLQVEAERRGSPAVEVLDAGARGLAALPEPAPGDVFFDFEGDPLVGDGGLEYLVGVLWVDESGAEQYVPFWAHTPAEESALTAALLRWLTDHLDAHPGAHAYHYAPYEVTALRRLCERHGHSEDLLDELLAAGRLVDLHRVVTAGVAAGVESYSIKHLEPLYGLERGGDVTTSVGSIVAYEQYLRADGEDAERMLEQIEAYNRDDCVSTLRLRDWLEELRATHGIERGGPTAGDEATDLFGGGHDRDEAAQQRVERRRALAELTAALRASGDPVDSALAKIVGWHDRESSTAWRDFFDRVAATPDELRHSTEAVSGLEVVSATDDEWVLTYPPQEHKLRVGSTGRGWVDHSGAFVGKVVEVSRAQRRITIARTAAGAHPPQALIAPGPHATDTIKARVRAYAEARRDGDRRTDAVAALLARTPEPALSGLDRDGDPLEVLRTAAARLDGGYLAVQGPPGTGKTYLGARVICDLLSSGRTVGICGPNHRAIDNLYFEVVEVAKAAGVALTAVRRHGADHAERYTFCDGPVRSVCAKSNGPAANSLVGRNRELRGTRANLIAGTSWLYCSRAVVEACESAPLDYLVIDEAGQYPLAELVAAGQVARNLILLGDPSQLPQVEVAHHGQDAAISALGHLTDGAATIDVRLGVFLDQTRRMSAPLCGNVAQLAYDGRLRSHPSAAGRHVLTADGRHLSGVVRVEVPHTNNATSSIEEADAVAELVGDLLAARYVDEDGAKPITPADIVVIAPFNAHVALLTERLCALDPGFAEQVGTVDRFQGREAAVSIYALGTSGGDALSRGADFVFSTQRLNVALSRAKAAAFVVVAPSLLDQVATNADDLAAISRFLTALG